MSRDEICQIYFGNIEALLGPFEHYTLYIPLLRLYWDRLNIIQLQALPGISSCLLIQPPPPDDFLQHTFGFDNTENILSIFFIVENIIHADNPVLIQSPHGGEFSQHTCHGNHNLVFVLHLYVYLFHLLCLFVCFLHQFVCFFSPFFASS